MDILEKLVHIRLENKRIDMNREWFYSEDNGEDFITIINECKNVLEK